MVKRIVLPVVILIICISGIVLSYMLLEVDYFGDAPWYVQKELAYFSQLTSNMCGEITSFVSCTAVAKSKYSKIFTIPVAALGISFYTLLTFLIVFGIFSVKVLRPPIAVFFFWSAGIGSLADITLLLISIFVVDALCPLCLATYICTWLGIGGAIFFLIQYRTSPFEILRSFKSIYILNSTRVSFKRASVTVCILIISLTLGYGANHYLDSKRKSYQARKEQELFEKVKEAFENENSIDIEVDLRMIIGDPNAPITIVEFSDFLCPYCAKAAQAVDQVVQENPGKVKSIFMNYPLDLTCNPYLKQTVHPGACFVAAGAICSAKQGRFEEYQRIVFQVQIERPIERPTLGVLKELAKESGLMLPEFVRCLTNHITLNTIAEHIEEGNRLGITGTPAIFINGKRYRGLVEKEWLQKFIDMEWERMKGARP